MQGYEKISISNNVMILGTKYNIIKKRNTKKMNCLRSEE